MQSTALSQMCIVCAIMCDDKCCLVLSQSLMDAVSVAHGCCLSRYLSRCLSRCLSCPWVLSQLLMEANENEFLVTPPSPVMAPAAPPGGGMARPPTHGHGPVTPLPGYIPCHIQSVEPSLHAGWASVASPSQSPSLSPWPSLHAGWASVASGPAKKTVRAYTRLCLG